MKTYNYKQIETKWRQFWQKNNTFKTDIKTAKKPFYNLMMFPYPSGEGLHVGHTYAFGGADTYGRFMRLQGYDVFEPMGFDAFGIHSENFAIKKGLHPKDLIAKTTTYFKEKQMKPYGGMWDWDHEVNTTDPDYYRWTQWLFIQLFKQGLVERKSAPVNWCPSCKTVISDEQVEAQGDKNVCERCKSEVERKQTEQWFFKITDYAECLLDYHGTKWPETTKQMQEHWIGKKQGIDITYPIKNTKDTVTCFTTRPDTNFGATFIVIAPEHPLVGKITNNKLQMTNKSQIPNDQVQKYVKKAKKKSEMERIAEGRTKTGVFTGLYAINHLTNKEMPIWVSDFVLKDFGTGAVVGVPGHDLRDFEFAQKFNLPIIRVVVGSDGDKSEITKPDQVQEDEGVMINSEFLDGMEIHKATQKIMDYMEKKGWGKRVTTYRLRDWCISRQRYWGPPIPMIYCKSCGWLPEKEENLPVLLPEIEDYQPKGKGQSPLAEVEEFYKTKCPKCSGPARRETDVSDTFLDSAWYFLRYPSVNVKTRSLHKYVKTGSLHGSDFPWDPEITKRWLPVDMYIGGNEHACMHLLYARFITMALHDAGLIDFQEPFKQFFAHGLIIKDGAKMSKSRGNVVNPNDYMDKYGADALRMYLLFLGPYPQGGDFRDSGMQGMSRFLNRVYNLAQKAVKRPGLPGKTGSSGINPELNQKLHQTIKKVQKDIQNLKFNTSIAAIMELTNLWQEKIKGSNKDFVGVYARLIAPFTPFLSEELWQMADGTGSVLGAGWPKYEANIAKEAKKTIVVQINGKLKAKLEMAADQASQKDQVLAEIDKNNQIQEFLAGKKPKKTIFIPAKLVNLVV